jgi:hypothetical protein
MGSIKRNRTGFIVLKESLDSVGIGFSGVQIAVLRHSALMGREEIIDRYQFARVGFDRLVVRQGIKSI